MKPFENYTNHPPIKYADDFIINPHSFFVKDVISGVGDVVEGIGSIFKKKSDTWDWGGHLQYLTQLYAKYQSTGSVADKSAFENYLNAFLNGTASNLKGHISYMQQLQSAALATKSATDIKAYSDYFNAFVGGIGSGFDPHWVNLYYPQEFDSTVTKTGVNTTQALPGNNTNNNNNNGSNSLMAKTDNTTIIIIVIAVIVIVAMFIFKRR